MNFVSLGMEILFFVLVNAALLIFSVYLLKRRYDHRLLSEQSKSSSFAIIESQLKQKNMMLSQELDLKKKETAQLQQLYDALKEKLNSHFSQESSQRVSFQEQLNKTKEIVSAASPQLQATIEAQTAKLHRLQQLLHDEQVTHKRTEEIFALKEADYRQKIAELHETVLTLKTELTSTAEGLNKEHSTRQIIEHDTTKREQELLEHAGSLESELTLLKDEHQKLSEEYSEEHSVRLATEHALQESKEKLYAHIHALEEKKAEQETSISTLRIELEDEKEKFDNLQLSFNTVLHTIPVPIFVVNDEGFILLANDALLSTLGFTSEEITGKHFSHLFPRDERLFFEEQWSSTANRVEQFKGETNFAASTGDVVSADMNIAALSNGADKTYIAFLIDRTIERESAKHFQEAKQREKELTELKSRFISMVVNQLRAALVTVATNTELLERFMFKWDDEKRYRSFLRINNSLKQMLDLLRNVESSTTTQRPPAMTTVNLETLAQSAAQEAAAELDAKHRFILSEQGDISSVKIDETAARTILFHILSNAFKFSSEDTEVKLHIERTDSACTFIVHDRGTGIPLKEQQYVFQSFFRGSNTGATHGTGLGLTIVQQYVQRAQGSVSIESQQDKGTTVTIVLPIFS